MYTVRRNGVGFELNPPMDCNPKEKEREESRTPSVRMNVEEQALKMGVRESR